MRILSRKNVMKFQYILKKIKLCRHDDDDIGEAQNLLGRLLYCAKYCSDECIFGGGHIDYLPACLLLTNKQNADSITPVRAFLRE